MSHDPSEIMLINVDLLLKKHVVLSSVLKTVVLLNVYGSGDTTIFKILSKSSK